MSKTSPAPAAPAAGVWTVRSLGTAALGSATEVPSNGSVSGAGRAAATASRRAASRAASIRSARTGAAARASTSSSGPRAGWWGRGDPTRAVRVAIVVSATKGTSPVSAS